MTVILLGKITLGFFSSSEFHVLKIYSKLLFVQSLFARENQKFINNFYCSFWRFGEWVPIIIDDRLPTVYKRLKFTQAPKNEFWAPLLEKAYAKFYGSSYGAIKDGSASEAMTDFTGGIIERYNRKHLKDPTNLFNVIQTSL